MTKLDLFPDLPPEPARRKRKIGRPKKLPLNRTQITPKTREDYERLAAKHGIYFADRRPRNALTSVRWQVPKWAIGKVANRVDANGYFTTTYNRLEWRLINMGPILDHFKPKLRRLHYEEGRPNNQDDAIGHQG